MPCNCRGKCSTVKKPEPGTGIYKRGYGRCNVCSVYIKTEEIRCFCCSMKLRRSSRMAIYKKINQKREVKIVEQEVR